VGDWYTVGLAAGLGLAVGVLVSGLLAGRRGGLLASLVLAAAAGAGLGLLVENWDEALGGLVGGAAGAFGAAPIVSGALRRGGTRGATGALVAVAAVILGVLALVPFVGYLEAVVLPGLAARHRRRAPERYAGLRTLAK
jgi:hypothetical protein